MLGVARRELGSATETGFEDEATMTFLGFLTFLDPPMPGVKRTLHELAELGVSVRIVTGDNRLTAAHVAQAVGLDAERLMTGEELERVRDDKLERRVAGARFRRGGAPAQGADHRRTSPCGPRRGLPRATASTTRLLSTLYRSDGPVTR